MKIDSNKYSLKRNNIKGIRVYKTGSNDRKYASVTSVTSIKSAAGIARWRKRVGKKEADRISGRALKIGSKAHNIIESYIKGNPVGNIPDNRSVISHARGFKKFVDERVSDVLACECMLYSDALESAGTADLIGNVDGELSIIDFKTSRKPKPKSFIGGYFIQGAAYSYMLREREGLSCKKIVVVITNETDNVVQVFKENPRNYIEEFVSLRKKYKEIHGF